MDNKSYIQSISNEDISLSRLSSLNKIENKILKETSIILKEKK